MDANYIAYETLVANRAAADWAFWSMIGAWFSGIATFLAVCISLVVAFGRPKPKIRGTVEINIVSPPPYNNHLHGVGVKINNVGAHQVKITSLVWRFSKSVRVVYLASQPGDSLPKKLEHGDSSNFFFLSDEEGEWLEDIREWIDKAGSRASKLRVEVTLGTGDVVLIKPQKEVIEFLSSR